MLVCCAAPCSQAAHVDIGGSLASMVPVPTTTSPAAHPFAQVQGTEPRARSPISPGAAAAALNSTPSGTPVKAPAPLLGPVLAALHTSSAAQAPADTAAIEPAAIEQGRFRTASHSGDVREPCGLEYSSCSATMLEEEASGSWSVPLPALPAAGRPAAPSVLARARMSASGVPHPSPALSSGCTWFGRRRSNSVTGETVTPRDTDSILRPSVGSTPATAPPVAVGPGRQLASSHSRESTPSVTPGITPRPSKALQVLSLTHAVVQTLEQSLGVELSWGQSKSGTPTGGVCSSAGPSEKLRGGTRHVQQHSSISRCSSRGTLVPQAQQVATGSTLAGGAEGGWADAAGSDGLVVTSRASSANSVTSHQSTPPVQHAAGLNVVDSAHSMLPSSVSCIPDGLHAAGVAVIRDSSGLVHGMPQGPAASSSLHTGPGSVHLHSTVGDAGNMSGSSRTDAALSQLWQPVAGAGPSQTAWPSRRDTRSQSASGTPLPAIPPTPRESDAGVSMAGHPRSSVGSFLAGWYSSRGASMSGVPDVRSHSKTHEACVPPHTTASGVIAHVQPHNWVTPRSTDVHETQAGTAAATPPTAPSTGHHAMPPMPDFLPSHVRVANSGRASYSGQPSYPGSGKPPLVHMHQFRSSMPSPSVLAPDRPESVLSVTHAQSGPGATAAGVVWPQQLNPELGVDSGQVRSSQTRGLEGFAGLPTRRALELGMRTPRMSAPGSVLPSAPAPARLL